MLQNRRLLKNVTVDQAHGMVLIVAVVVAEVLSCYTEIHPATETPVCV